MRYAPQLPLQEKYWHPIEHEIIHIWADLIFRPLLGVLQMPEDEIQNTGAALLEAVRMGTVWYADGHFSGEYDSKITRDLRGIGALYNTPSRTWSLSRDFLPIDIRIAQAAADSRYNDLRRGFIRTLDDIQIDSINRMSEIPDRYIQTVDWMEGDFKKTLKAITIVPQLTQMQRGTIAAEWGQNLDLYVKGWASEKILEMREAVQVNAFEGRRANDLVEMLRNTYGVSQRKARFLARQETSLLLSKFREMRYRDAGSERYRWDTSHDERVRSDHAHLNGKIFRWDTPPITNHRTGAHNNPGEDFGCRCVGVAVFD